MGAIRRRRASLPTAVRAEVVSAGGPSPAAGRRALLLALFEAAVARASPAACLTPLLPQPPKRRTVVIGGGKAAAAMARAVEDNWPGPLSGLVITRYGHGVPCARIEVVEASHPVPDDAGAIATTRMRALLDGLTGDDLVLCLWSGGGSALMPAPAGGLSMADARQLTAALLRSGATIAEMNCVRKHLSAVKGGRLALAAGPAQVETFVISDVPGDDPATIASGPTVPDPTTRQEALGVIDRYGLAASGKVREWLADPASETPKVLAHSRCTTVATPLMALDAAATAAQEAGYQPVILGADIEGEACNVAADHAALVRDIVNGTSAIAPPCVLLSGGETTVTIKGQGRGGRNAEYLLALALALDGMPRVHAIAADTDGIDGTEDNAGATLHPETLADARHRGIDAAARLADNDGYGFFQSLGALVVTGPTMTNVNDFRAILIDAI
jgi:glycerate 2-kinase